MPSSRLFGQGRRFGSFLRSNRIGGRAPSPIRPILLWHQAGLWFRRVPAEFKGVGQQRPQLRLSWPCDRFFDHHAVLTNHNALAVFRTPIVVPWMGGLPGADRRTAPDGPKTTYPSLARQ
jgi:hypothetical protein